MEDTQITDITKKIKQQLIIDNSETELVQQFNQLNVPKVDIKRKNIKKDRRCLAITPKETQCNISKSTRKNVLDPDLCFKHNQSLQKGQKIIKITDTEAIQQLHKKQKIKKASDPRKLNNFKREEINETSSCNNNYITSPVVLFEPVLLPSQVKVFNTISSIKVVDKGDYFEDSMKNIYPKHMLNQ